MSDRVTVGQIRRAIEGLPDAAFVGLVEHSDVEDVIVTLDAVRREGDCVYVHVTTDWLDDEDDDDWDDDEEGEDEDHPEESGPLAPMPDQMGLFTEEGR